MNSISSHVWDLKYRLKNPDGAILDQTIYSTWARVAKALAEAEKPDKRQQYEDEFYYALLDFKFLPAGRIIAGAGTGRNVTMFNCYVMGTIADSMKGIFKSVTESALTQQQGGGIGMDFSTLRPKGALVKGVASTSSGPLSFMDVWNSMCKTIMSAGSRRGAMMGTMLCTHPDIEEFIDVKRDMTRLRNFNLSVLCTDKFMTAVSKGDDWPLSFNGQVYKTVKADYLWNKIMQSTYDVAEPGVIFIDRINKANNLAYCETIQATNPCGEQPLPPYGACLLGSINLAAHVEGAFTDNSFIPFPDLIETVTTAVHMMDNVIDVSKFPLPEQELEAKDKRRMGLGLTGLADALAMCGMKYNSPKAIKTAGMWMKTINDAAYLASANLAQEKGSFPRFDIKYLDSPMIKSLDKTTQELIRNHGTRNSHLTSIAPTGTISLFAKNVSSGIEPMFALEFDRKMLQPDGSMKVEQVTDFAVTKWRELYGDKKLSDVFVTVEDLKPIDHINMQAELQKFVDSSISKTVNVPKDISFDEFKDVYSLAYNKGLKSCATYRPNDVTGSILSVKESKPVTVDTNSLLERDEQLPGSTYKIKPLDHAIYITINDIMINGKRQPFEIFFNSKNMEHFQWVVALSRMISAVFRRGGDTSFVIEELKAVFDPCGGHWANGKFLPSVVAAIGGVIERHMTEIGMIESSKPNSTKAICPKCNTPSLVRTEGCDKCLECDYSKCG